MLQITIEYVKKQFTLENFKDPKLAFITFTMWVSIFLVTLGEVGAFSHKFIHFGPSNDPKTQTEFIGMKIDSWDKVISVMIIGFFSVLFSSYYHQIVEPWLTNVIRDDDTKNVNISNIWAYSITIGDPILRWVNGTLRFFVTLTLQLQFIIPQMIAEVLVTIISTKAYFKNKTFVDNGSNSEDQHVRAD